MSTQLGCPICESTDLRSDETATIGYSVRLTRTPSGALDVEYTGESYTVFDEGTEFEGDIWCRGCGENFNESALVEVVA